MVSGCLDVDAPVPVVAVSVAGNEGLSTCREFAEESVFPVAAVISEASEERLEAVGD